MADSAPTLPPDSIAFADAQIRAHLDQAEAWMQKAIERRGSFPNGAESRRALQLCRAQTSVLVLLLPP